MPHQRLLTLVLTTLISFNLAAAPSSRSEVVPADEIEWGYLNPLRGKLSPGAADLWGDRTKDAATGMLVKFKKGFSSPPHIHNITYRGVVIQGLLHNDDPSAQKMWMPAGSFWTQPAGEEHITAANDNANLIFLEIDSGPYLVKPSEHKFDNGERPINLHASNLVWVEQSDLAFIEAEGVAMSFLWGRHQAGYLGGALVKLPKGFQGKLEADANEFRAIVISDDIRYQSEQLSDGKELTPGSYFGSTGSFRHDVSAANTETLIYIRTDGQLRITTH